MDRCATLRDLQKELCRLFGQRFPATMACLTISGIVSDEFGEMPFLNVVAGDEARGASCVTCACLFTEGCACTPVALQAVMVEVSFVATDDPFFFDQMDRTSPKSTLEEDVLYESEFESGTTTLSQSDWLRSRFDTSAWLRARSPFREDTADDRNEYMNNYEDWLRAWPQERVDVAFLPPWEEICRRHA